MYYIPAPKPVDTATDARYTHKGKFSGWLIKAKSDGAKAKWFQTTGRRYFTIDFDRQILFYSHGESQPSQVSTPVPFRDILNAYAGHSYEADDLGMTKGSGIMRTVAGVMSKPRSTIPGHYPFTVRTVGKRLRLEAEVEKDVFDWIQMLNAASRIAKSVDIFSGGMETSEKADIPRPATPDSSAASTGSGGEGKTLSELSGQQSTIDDAEDDSSENLLSPDPLSEPCDTKFTERPIRFPAWAAAEDSEEQSRKCADKESTTLQHNQGQQLQQHQKQQQQEQQQQGERLLDACLGGYLGNSGPSSLIKETMQPDERIASKGLSARDFGFEDEEDLEADNAASLEASPIASPRVEFRSALIKQEVEEESRQAVIVQQDTDKIEESDDDIIVGAGQAAGMDASRVAADIMLLQRQCPAAKKKKKDGPPKRKGAKDDNDCKGQQDQAARMAADLMLLQTAAKKSSFRSSSRVRARNVVAE